MKMANRGPVAYSLKATPIMAALCVPVIWYFSGLAAVAGFGLGAALSWGSLLAANTVVGGINGTKTKFSAQSRLQLLLLAKLPAFMIVIFFTNSLGTGALIAFLAGYLLVYLALVLGAFLKSNPSTSTDDLR